MGLAFDSGGNLYVAAGLGTNSPGFSVFSSTTNQWTTYVYAPFNQTTTYAYYPGLAISGSTLYLSNY